MHNHRSRGAFALAFAATCFLSAKPARAFHAGVPGSVMKKGCATCHSSDPGSTPGSVEILVGSTSVAPNAVVPVEVRIAAGMNGNVERMWAGFNAYATAGTISLQSSTPVGDAAAASLSCTPPPTTAWVEPAADTKLIAGQVTHTIPKMVTPTDGGPDSASFFFDLTMPTCGDAKIVARANNVNLDCGPGGDDPMFTSVTISTNGGACGQGAACQSDATCSSGHCVDGVCCDTACTGQCEACDVSGSEGTCTMVASGAPHGSRTACATDGTACGGTCDGTSTTACGYAGGSTACGQAACSNGAATEVGTCNGAGACNQTTTDCAPYACDTTTCKAACANDSDCASGATCVGGQCVAATDGGVADATFDVAADAIDDAADDGALDDGSTGSDGAAEDGAAGSGGSAVDGSAGSGGGAEDGSAGSGGGTADGSAGSSGSAGKDAAAGAGGSSGGDASTGGDVTPAASSDDDSGCSCRTPGAPRQSTGYGALALAGLALAASRSRRRR